MWIIEATGWGWWNVDKELAWFPDDHGAAM